ncbi:MAG: ankyrin repeat domain-containing protein [Betaproteobacteria bacterium]|nr:ankyrin repeat domain-containing protein [Betaproteobacteria bacterium]
MSSPADLIKAVRSGHLVEVLAALEAGATAELNDGQGVPGLPLGIACFMGFPDIVRELVKRGAKVNIADNREPVSPLSMAIRGGKTEVVRLLVELGAEVPEGMVTGLSEAELTAAKGVATTKKAPPAHPFHGDMQVIEEIIMPRAFGTDTTVLEADVMRSIREAEEQKKPR